MRSKLLLSEAILLGAMLKPQGRRGTGERGGLTSCAFGAALDADHSVNDVLIGWPWIETMDGQCPACDKVFGATIVTKTFAVIPHLNNGHEWTRERIAGWVKTKEPQPVVAYEEVSACN